MKCQNNLYIKINISNVIIVNALYFRFRCIFFCFLIFSNETWLKCRENGNGVFDGIFKNICIFPAKISARCILGPLLGPIGRNAMS